MKKRNMKLTAALSAAALLTIGGAMTSAAASGWVEENGVWYYYDSYGDAVTNEWKKSGNHWFYLGDDGAMVKDQVVEDDGNYYYVNEDGAMSVNRWVRVDPSTADADDTDADYIYYYFGSNGRAYKNTSDGISKKTIDGKTYAFNEYGHMLTGWVTEDGEMLTDTDDPFIEGTYYFGAWNDGAMTRNTWLEYIDGSDEQSNVDNIEYADYDTLWLYFDSNGKKVSAGSDDTKEKTINGQKYVFDQNGIMLSAWVDTSASPSTPSHYFSSSLDGHLQKKTWIYAVPNETMDPEDYENDQQRWFYAGSNGSIYKDAIKTINGKKYIFDDIGRMRSGFVIVDSDNEFAGTIDREEVERDDFVNGTISELLVGNKLYYFSGDEEKDGSMKTGKSVSIELSDDTYTFGFASSGRAYGTDGTELVSGKYYENGLLLKADSDYKYGVVEADGEYYVVGTSGSKQSGSNKIVSCGNDCYILMKDGKYFSYIEADHKPIYKDGVYYEYDEDADGHRGDEIAEDDGSALPEEMKLNFE